MIIREFKDSVLNHRASRHSFIEYSLTECLSVEYSALRQSIIAHSSIQLFSIIQAFHHRVSSIPSQSIQAFNHRVLEHSLTEQRIQSLRIRAFSHGAFSHRAFNHGAFTHRAFKHSQNIYAFTHRVFTHRAFKHSLTHSLTHSQSVQAFIQGHARCKTLVLWLLLLRD